MSNALIHFNYKLRHVLDGDLVPGNTSQTPVLLALALAIPLSLYLSIASPLAPMRGAKSSKCHSVQQLPDRLLLATAARAGLLMTVAAAAANGNDSKVLNNFVI